MNSAPAHPVTSHVQQGVHVHAQAFEHSQAVTSHLRAVIAAAGGWLSFSDWMDQVLYAPGLGYYAAGSEKLALRADHNQVSPGGDFVTAPEMSSAFGRTIAQQIAQVMRAEGLTQILEFGAGSGQLACDVLQGLHADGFENISYCILEVSQDLRARQQVRLSQEGLQVQWLDSIPDDFEGIMIANEVLDAMPVHIVQWETEASSQLLERGVIWNHQTQNFDWQTRPAPSLLTAALSARMPALPGYFTEINLQGEAWVRTLAKHLRRGLILLIDYGFPQSEYYHPQRSQGTLMCHVQHHAHADPFFAPGLQDITAHVDFSAMAASAHDAGLHVLGYTSQARFLMNARIDQVILQDPSLQTPQSMQAIQKILSEAEMGELFKVLALGRDIGESLIGFSRGDRRHQL